LKVRIIDWPPKKKPQTLKKVWEDEEFRRKIDYILAKAGIPIRSIPPKKRGITQKKGTKQKGDNNGSPDNRRKQGNSRRSEKE